MADQKMGRLEKRERIKFAKNLQQVLVNFSEAIYPDQEYVELFNASNALNSWIERQEEKINAIPD